MQRRRQYNSAYFAQYKQAEFGERNPSASDLEETAAVGADHAKPTGGAGTVATSSRSHRIQSAAPSTSLPRTNVPGGTLTSQRIGRIFRIGVLSGPSV